MSAQLLSRGAASLVLLLALLAGPSLAQIQQDSNLPQPRLLTLTPPGGKAGTVVEVSFFGTDVEEPQGLLFSHPGLKAEPIQPPPPPPPDPKKKPPTPPPPPPQVTSFKVTIAPDVPLGVHDVCLVNKWGVSNPRAFLVGDLPEAVEKEPNNDVDAGQRIELNSAVHGVIAAGTDVDYFVFTGKKGQRVVFSCLSSSIDSKLNAGIEIYAASGQRVGASRNYRADDALTDVVLPADGDYLVRVFEFSHTAGSREYFYRLSVSTAPWIDAIHPAVLQAGKPTQVTLYGRNLPGGTLDPQLSVDGRPLEKATATITAPADAAGRQRLGYRGVLLPQQAEVDGFEHRVKNASGSSNPFLLAATDLPVLLDADGSRTASAPQEVTPPCEIAGRILQRRERDWYAFSAKKGDVVQIDLQSERLGAPTLMYFQVRSAADGRTLYESTDNNDPINQKFYGRTDDPLAYRFTAPADGKYLVLVGSHVGDIVAGPRTYYRLRLAPPQPDFGLVVQSAGFTRPESPTLLQGGREFLSVITQPRDGFTGEITLSVEGLPAGVTAQPQVMGPGVRHQMLVLQAVDGAAAWTGEIKVRGTAEVAGKKVTREALSGTMVWQLPNLGQPAPAVSRVARRMVLAVRPIKPPFDVTTSLDRPMLVQGDKGTLTVKVKRIWPDYKQPLIVQVQAQDVPPGLTFNNNQPLTLAPDKADGTLAIQTTPTVQPGTYTVVLRANAQIPYNKDPMAKQKPNTNVILPSAPVTLTVLPKTVAKVTLSTQGATAKLGDKAEVVVRLERLFGYSGPLKVEVTPAAGLRGLQVSPLEIPAAQSEGKLVFTAPAGLAVGNRTGLIVRTTASLPGGVTATQDAPPLSVNVVK